MIILLHGPDAARRIAKKREIIAEYVKRHVGTSVFFFDMEADGAAAALADCIGSRSLFETTKLIITEQLFSHQTAALARLVRSLASVASITLIIDEDTSRIPKPFSFLEADGVITQSFEYLDATAWNAYVAKHAREAGLRLTPDAIATLARFFLKNTWGLLTELSRLGVRYHGETLDRRDIESALSYMATGDFFKTVNGLRSNVLAVRLGALEQLFKDGHEPAKIFALSASLFPRESAAYADFDLLIKQGKLDYEEALVDLALR